MKLVQNSAVVAILFAGILSVNATTPPPSELNLEKLYQASLLVNEDVAQRSEEVIQREEQKSQVSGTLLPTVQGLGSYLKQDSPSDPIRRNLTPTLQRNARINARQFIFQGGSEYSFLNQTKKNLSASQELLKAEKQKLYLELSTLYLNTLLRQKELSYTENELVLFGEQVKELSSRVKIGRSRRSDVLVVETAQAQLLARKKAIEQELKAFETQLTSLTQLNIQSGLKEELPFNSELKPLEFYMQSSQAQPDLKAAGLLRDASESGIGVARGRHLPTLDVTGNYFLRREGFNDGQWDASLNLVVPIFAGGTTQSAVREAASQYRVMEVQYQKLLRERKQSIETLHHNLESSKEEILALQKAKESSEKTYQQLRKDFRFGLVSNLDLVQALKDNQAAKRTYDQTVYRHYLERIQLEITAGLLPQKI
jgi:outer membrane protein